MLRSCLALLLLLAAAAPPWRAQSGATRRSIIAASSGSTARGRSPIARRGWSTGRTSRDGGAARTF